MSRFPITSVAPNILIDDDGQVKMDASIFNMLDTFQGDSIDYMYDIEPQSQNLFYAGYFRESDELGGNQRRPFFNAAYRIKGVSWNLPKLTFKHHKYNYMPQLDTHEYNVTVKVDWFEDVYHSVKKYHWDWMARWYNRAFDVLRCGPEGKFRRMALIAFHYVNSVSEDEAGLIEVPVVQPLFVCDFAGMVPEDMGDMKWSYGSDGNDEHVQISYKVASMRWFYADQLAAGSSRSTIWNSGATLTGPEPRSWNPTGFAQDKANGEANDNGDLERIRVARAATSFMAGESIS